MVQVTLKWGLLFLSQIQGSWWQWLFEHQRITYQVSAKFLNGRWVAKKWCLSNNTVHQTHTFQLIFLGSFCRMFPGCKIRWPQDKFNHFSGGVKLVKWWGNLSEQWNMNPECRWCRYYIILWYIILCYVLYYIIVILYHIILCYFIIYCIFAKFVALCHSWKEWMEWCFLPHVRLASFIESKHKSWRRNNHLKCIHSRSLLSSYLMIWSIRTPIMHWGVSTFNIWRVKYVKSW